MQMEEWVKEIFSVINVEKVSHVFYISIVQFY